jgi:hypothetical protein
VPWPIAGSVPVISEKDKKLVSFAQYRTAAPAEFRAL